MKSWNENIEKIWNCGNVGTRLENVSNNECSRVARKLIPQEYVGFHVFFVKSFLTGHDKLSLKSKTKGTNLFSIYN